MQHPEANDAIEYNEKKYKYRKTDELQAQRINRIYSELFPAI